MRLTASLWGGYDKQTSRQSTAKVQNPRPGLSGRSSCLTCTHLPSYQVSQKSQAIQKSPTLRQGAEHRVSIRTARCQSMARLAVLPPPGHQHGCNLGYRNPLKLASGSWLRRLA